MTNLKKLGSQGPKSHKIIISENKNKRAENKFITFQFVIFTTMPPNLPSENIIVERGCLKHISSLKYEGAKAFKRKDYKLSKRLFVEAVESLQKVNKHVDSVLLFNTSLTYLQFGNLDKCREYLERAIRAEPFFALAMYFLGFVKRTMNDFDKFSDDNPFLHAVDMIKRQPCHKFMSESQKKLYGHLKDKMKNEVETKNENLRLKYGTVDYSHLGCDIKLTIEDCTLANINEDYSNIFTFVNDSENKLKPLLEQAKKDHSIIKVIPETNRPEFDLKIFQLKEVFTLGLHQRTYITKGDVLFENQASLAESDKKEESGFSIDNVMAAHLSKEARKQIAADKKIRSILAELGIPSENLKLLKQLIMDTMKDSQSLSERKIEETKREIQRNNSVSFSSVKGKERDQLEIPAFSASTGRNNASSIHCKYCNNQKKIARRSNKSESKIYPQPAVTTKSNRKQFGKNESIFDTLDMPTDTITFEIEPEEDIFAVSENNNSSTERKMSRNSVSFARRSILKKIDEDEGIQEEGDTVHVVDDSVIVEAIQFSTNQKPRSSRIEKKPSKLKSFLSNESAREASFARSAARRKISRMELENF